MLQKIGMEGGKGESSCGIREREEGAEKERAVELGGREWWEEEEEGRRGLRKRKEEGGITPP